MLFFDKKEKILLNTKVFFFMHKTLNKRRFSREEDLSFSKTGKRVIYGGNII